MDVPGSTNTLGSLPPPIHEMVRRIVARFDPDRVILFGSYARGAAGPNSDADLLVVMGIKGRKRATLVEIHRELGGVGLAKDVVLVTPEELEQRRHEPGSLIYSALQEGRVLYRAGRWMSARRPDSDLAIGYYEEFVQVARVGLEDRCQAVPLGRKIACAKSQVDDPSMRLTPADDQLAKVAVLRQKNTALLMRPTEDLRI